MPPKAVSQSTTLFSFFSVTGQKKRPLDVKKSAAVPAKKLTTQETPAEESDADCANDAIILGGYAMKTTLARREPDVVDEGSPRGVREEKGGNQKPAKQSCRVDDVKLDDGKLDDVKVDDVKVDDCKTDTVVEDDGESGSDRGAGASSDGEDTNESGESSSEEESAASEPPVLSDYELLRLETIKVFYQTFFFTASLRLFQFHF